MLQILPFISKTVRGMSIVTMEDFKVMDGRSIRVGSNDLE